MQPNPLIDLLDRKSLKIQGWSHDRYPHARV
jgi:hypothetical protein